MKTDLSKISTVVIADNDGKMIQRFSPDCYIVQGGTMTMQTDRLDECGHLINWWYEDENGCNVKVIGVVGGWCMVVSGNEKPYCVPLSFVKSLYKDWVESRVMANNIK